MKISKAYTIFCDIENPKISDEEKGAAIWKVVNMETHNSITKAEMLKVIRYLTGLASLYNFQWLIIGAMTGPGSKDRQPKREWVEEIVKAARDFGVPVFMKKNLVNVWGDNLIQQYPAGMVQDDAKGPAPLPRCKKCEYATATPQGKRGISYACEIGWEAAGYDDRGARGIPGRYTRTSPPWCPLRGKDGPM